MEITDFGQIEANHKEKRAIEIALAGDLNIVLAGDEHLSQMHTLVQCANALVERGLKKAGVDNKIGTYHYPVKVEAGEYYYSTNEHPTLEVISNDILKSKDGFVRDFMGIHMLVVVSPNNEENIFSKRHGVMENEPTDKILERIKKAKEILEKDKTPITINHVMESLTEASKNLLKVSIERLGLGYSETIIKNIFATANTIRAIANEKDIRPEHVAEAIQYSPRYFGELYSG